MRGLENITEIIPDELKTSFQMRIYAKDIQTFKTLCALMNSNVSTVFRFLLRTGGEHLNVLFDGLDTETAIKQQEIDFILKRRTRSNHRGYLGSNFLKVIMRIIWSDYALKKPYSMNIIKNNIADYEKVYARLSQAEQKDQEEAYKDIISLKTSEGITEYLNKKWFISSSGKPSGLFKEKIRYHHGKQ